MNDKQTDDKPTFFVSRRGRQVGVHQVDLSDMDIDSDQSDKEQKQFKKTSKKQEVTRTTSKPSKRSYKFSKKKIAALFALLALLLLPVIAAELVVAEYDRGTNSAKQDLASIVNKTVLPAQKKADLRADQIRTMATEVNDVVGKMCRGGLLDNAAGLYPRAKDALADCKTSQALYTALASELYGLEKVARYLEAMDGVMKPVATPITEEFAVIGSQQSSWIQADQDLKKLSVPDEMRSAHSSLSTHVSAVATAWSSLNTANNEQDAAGFTESEKKLASEYEAIRAVSAEFTEVLSKAQTELLSSYNKLN